MKTPLTLHGLAGISWYYATSLITLAAAWLAADFLSRQSHPNGNEPGFVNSLGNWDGYWYARVAREGYFFNAERPSSVAFFPAYPLAGAAVTRITGLKEEVALLVVSHACLVALFILLAAYVRARSTEASQDLVDWTLLAFGLWPLSFFFRMAYSESLFVLVLVAALYAMRRAWPAPAVAVIVGLATACRPVGVALLPVFAWWLWRRRTSWPRLALTGGVCLPLATWGLAAYMAYQQYVFGDAFAFVKVQQNWAVRTDMTPAKRIQAILTLEPFWSKYVPNSPVYWAKTESVENPLFSLEFMNPLFVMATAALVGVGAWRKWLSAEELILAVFLLGIPYMTHAYPAGMLGQGRYAASVFPAYLVLGQLLHRAPPAVAALLLAFSASLMAAYAALFAAWYRFI